MTLHDQIDIPFWCCWQYWSLLPHVYSDMDASNYMYSKAKHSHNLYIDVMLYISSLLALALAEHICVLYGVLLKCLCHL